MTVTAEKAVLLRGGGIAGALLGASIATAGKELVKGLAGPLVKGAIKHEANKAVSYVKAKAQSELKQAYTAAKSMFRNRKDSIKKAVTAAKTKAKRGNSKGKKGVKLGLRQKGITKVKKGVKFATKVARYAKKEGPKKTAKLLAKRAIAKGVSKIAYPHMVKLGKAYDDNVPWIAKPLLNKAIIAGMRKAHSASQRNFATEGLYLGLHDALRTARVGPFTGGALKLFNRQQNYKYDECKVANLRKLYTHMLRPADSDYIESGLMGSSIDGGSLASYLPGALGREMFKMLAARKGEGNFKEQLRELYGGSIVADYDSWNLGTLPDKEFENKLVEASIREHMHDKGKLEGGGVGLFIAKFNRGLHDIDRSMSEGKIPVTALKNIKNALPWFGNE